MSSQELLQVKHLIKAKRYDEARERLILIDDPIADKWLARLNQIAPVKEPESFTLKAVLVLALYWAMWIPGLVANIIFLNQARKVKARTHSSPEGMGCLWALLLIHIVGLLIACIGIFIYTFAFTALWSEGPAGGFIYTLF